MGLEPGNDIVSFDTSPSQSELIGRDMLAHLPAERPTPLVRPSPRADSPTRLYGPKTPVTVTSSFDDHWDAARKELETKKIDRDDQMSQNGQKTMDTPRSEVGQSGAGLHRGATLGQRVEVKGMKGRRRRGVGPGVT